MSQGNLATPDASTRGIPNVRSCFLLCYSTAYTPSTSLRVIPNLIGNLAYPALHQRTPKMHQVRTGREPLPRNRCTPSAPISEPEEPPLLDRADMLQGIITREDPEVRPVHLGKVYPGNNTPCFVSVYGHSRSRRKLLTDSETFLEVTGAHFF